MIFRGRIIRVFAVVSLVGAAALAQITVPRVAESIDVRVTNLDVVVTDATGKRVRGLTRDDFEVYDNGKRQTITNFAEYSAEPRPAPSAAATQTAAPAEAAATPAAARHIVIFFDAFSTSRESRRRLIPALTKLVNTLHEGDEAMVVSWNRSLRVSAPTSDHAALIKAIERGASEASLQREALSSFGDRMGDLPAMAGAATSNAARRAADERRDSRRRAREAAIDLEQSVQALRGILERMAGVEGRKALILVSATYSFMPPPDQTEGSDDDVLFWLETINAPPRLRELADAASAAGVAIYGIQSEGLTSGWSASTPGDKGAGVALADGLLPSEIFTTNIPSLEKARTGSVALDGLTYLAARTGGFAAGYANYFDRAIASVGNDMVSYYSIGYRSPDSAGPGRRNVEVRARDKRYTVRARHSVIDRSAEDELSDRVVGAVLFGTTSLNQLGIAANIVSTGREKDRLRVPVDIKIPMANLTFESGESELLVADLTIFIASSDNEGNLSPTNRFHQLIPITRAQLPGIAKQYYTYALNIDLRNAKAENRLAVGVLDNVSKATGLVTLDVKAPK